MAAGRGLSARCGAQQLRSLSNLTMFPSHTHADVTSHAHATYAHNHIFIQYSMYMLFSLVHPESRMQQQELKHAFHTPALSHILIIWHITSIITMVLLSPKNIFLIIFNYP